MLGTELRGGGSYLSLERFKNKFLNLRVEIHMCPQKHGIQDFAPPSSVFCLLTPIGLERYRVSEFEKATHRSNADSIP